MPSALQIMKGNSSMLQYYEWPQNRTSKEPDQTMLLLEVSCFLENLTQDLENEICTLILADDVKVAERINRHFVVAKKMLNALKSHC